MPQQIELRNIALQAAQPLVHGVSLTLQRGRVLALVGGSGSGKLFGNLPFNFHQRE